MKNFDDKFAEDICRLLQKASLLIIDEDEKHIRLHTILRKHLITRLAGSITIWHNRLLKLYRPWHSYRWSELPSEETYFWNHLAYHLLGAELGPELVNTVKDLNYLIKKVSIAGVLAVEQDLLSAQGFAARDSVLAVLSRSFVNASHLLNQCHDINEIASTLHSRIAHELALHEIIRNTKLLIPFITATHPLPDLPEPSLNRTLNGHTDKVQSCAINSEGTIVVSASADASLRIWDALSGMERAVLVGHTAIVTAVAISHDGTTCVSASNDGTVKLWDVSQGQLLQSLQLDAPVSDCAISRDKQTIVAAKDDNTLEIFEIGTGKRQLLSGHTAAVKSCAISGNGKLLLSASLDNTLNVWTMSDGKLLRTLSGHEAGVRGCAISPNGRIAVSASRDQKVIVWGRRNWKKSSGHFSLIRMVQKPVRLALMEKRSFQ